MILPLKVKIQELVQGNAQKWLFIIINDSIALATNIADSSLLPVYVASHNRRVFSQFTE